MKSIGIIVGMLLAGQILTAQVRRVFPKPVHKLELGMSLEAFSDEYETLDPYQLDREEFRYRWEQDLGGKKGIASATFYFDDGSDRPLYEVILVYDDLRARDQWLAKYYGPPNAAEGTEWAYELPSGYPLRAWCYKNRLVIVAALPGTEWAP